MTLKDEINRILEDYRKRAKAGDISSETYRACKSAFNKLSHFWANLSPPDITEEKWAEFQEASEELEPGSSQFNQTKYFRVLIKRLPPTNGLRFPEIKDRYHRREINNRRKKKNWIYSDDQIIALDKACQTPQERLAIRLGYLMAFRVSDVVRLSWERIISEHDRVFIEFTGDVDKASTVVKCPVPPNIIEVITSFPKTSKWLFPQKTNLNKHLFTRQLDYESIRNRAGIERGTFHDLRRYRLTKDFTNPKLPPALVCKIRRVSMNVAMESYLKPGMNELDLINRESK